MKKEGKKDIFADMESDSEIKFWEDIMNGLFNSFKVAKSLSKNANTHDIITRAYIDELCTYNEEKRRVDITYLEKYKSTYIKLLELMIYDCEKSDKFEECAVFKLLKDSISIK